jgi:hypothetical protein
LEDDGRPGRGGEQERSAATLTARELPVRPLLTMTAAEVWLLIS